MAARSSLHVLSLTPSPPGKLGHVARKGKALCSESRGGRDVGDVPSEPADLEEELLPGSGPGPWPGRMCQPRGSSPAREGLASAVLAPSEVRSGHSRGKTFLLVVPCHPRPSHPVTGGALGHQDQVMSRTPFQPLSDFSGPWHQIQNPCHGSYITGPGRSVVRDLYDSPSTHAVHFCPKQWFSLGKRGLRGG